MKIAIDASRAVNETAGVGRYTKSLIENLLKVDQKNQYRLFFNFVSNFSEKKKQTEQFKRENLSAGRQGIEIVIMKVPGRLKEKLLDSRIGFYRGKLKDCDVFIAPTFLDADLSLKISQVVLIHDLTMFRYPKLHLSPYFQKRTKLACEKAAKIVTISESTKDDLIKSLSIDQNKISVVYPGLNKFSAVASELPAGLKAQEYILSVGTLEPRKNLAGLFKSYSLLSEELKNKYPLVIVGATGWGTDEIFKEADKIKDKIKFLGYQSDDVLAKLYKEAKVFVYPSFYEGFGFPIIEAMQFGTPVITSNISSMPEAGGKAAVYINPEEPKSINAALQSVLEGKISIDKMSKLGKEQVTKFSWEKVAAEVIGLIRQI